MSRIQAHTLEHINEASDLAQLAREYGLNLRKVAGGYVALCVWHKEDTASLRINTTGQRRNSFTCFGCGKKGSIFTFVSLMEHISFPAAVRLLADRAGISIDDKTVPRVVAAVDREDREMCEWWWQRQSDTIRALMYEALESEDFPFAACLGRIVSYTAEIPDRLDQFKFRVTVKERKEFAAMKRGQVAWLKFLDAASAATGAGCLDA